MRGQEEEKTGGAVIASKPRSSNTEVACGRLAELDSN